MISTTGKAYPNIVGISLAVRITPDNSSPVSISTFAMVIDSADCAEVASVQLKQTAKSTAIDTKCFKYIALSLHRISFIVRHELSRVQVASLVVIIHLRFDISFYGTDSTFFFVVEFIVTLVLGGIVDGVFELVGE